MPATLRQPSYGLPEWSVESRPFWNGPVCSPPVRRELQDATSERVDFPASRFKGFPLDREHCVSIVSVGRVEQRVE